MLLLMPFTSTVVEINLFDNSFQTQKDNEQTWIRLKFWLRSAHQPSRFSTASGSMFAHLDNKLENNERQADDWSVCCSPCMHRLCISLSRLALRLVSLVPLNLLDILTEKSRISLPVNPTKTKVHGPPGCVVVLYGELSDTRIYIRVCLRDYKNICFTPVFNRIRF